MTPIRSDEPFFSVPVGEGALIVPVPAIIDIDHYGDVVGVEIVDRRAIDAISVNPADDGTLPRVSIDRSVGALYIHMADEGATASTQSDASASLLLVSGVLRCVTVVRL